MKRANTRSTASAWSLKNVDRVVVYTLRKDTIMAGVKASWPAELSGVFVCFSRLLLSFPLSTSVSLSYDSEIYGCASANDQVGKGQFSGMRVFLHII
jgi:hypothetical protein